MLENITQDKTVPYHVRKHHTRQKQYHNMLENITQDKTVP
jgi:uncharacterized protein (UPF0147 family)